MKNQKGITLVALVVTIVVLLILAGVSLAMLTGDNGIITNSQKASASNTAATAVEKMGIAYNAAKAESMVKMATVVGYQPNGLAGSDNYGNDLAKLVAKELGITSWTSGTKDTATGYTVTFNDGAGTANDTIVMQYDDATFDGTTTGDNKYPVITGTITLTTNSVSYTTLPTNPVQ